MANDVMIPDAPDPLILRDEFQTINVKLRQHNDGEEKLEETDYQKYLRRSLELLAQLNFTTAGPKATKAKSAVAAKIAKGDPNSLTDL